jgi:dTDP-glucose pyrophosphorylase/predicted transcriptional regulator
MAIINGHSTHGLIIVNQEDKLVASVTDGDVRRGILKGISIDSPVSQIMNTNPRYLNDSATTEDMIDFLRKYQIFLLPLVDNEKKVTRIESLNNLLNQQESIDNAVIIMAGGEGKRLLPLTEDCPKPLLKVGEKPLLETIFANLKDSGFSQFFVSVNYKAEMVKDYFGNGTSLGVNIDYIHEEHPLGTAGAIGLIQERPTKPFIVMNGDLLTKINFKHLLDFHTSQGAIATMAVREFIYQIPYGIVKMSSSHHVLAVEEKPIQKHYINAGIYVLDPSVFDFIPKNEFINMTDIFKTLIQKNQDVVAFPIHEYWLDIGQKDDYYKANNEISDLAL